MAKIKGGCLCEAVRFEAEVGEVRSMSCYCKDCQRATGSSCATFTAVPETALQVSGKPTSFITQGDSGRAVERSFCGRCGSQLWSQVEAMPGMIFLKIGVMDDSSEFAPQACIWTKSKPQWVHLPENLPSFDENPG